MKDSNLIFQQGHAQTPKQSLQNHQSERSPPEIAQPARVFVEPQPEGKDNRENSYAGSDQAMDMLEKYSADPLRNRKKKHIVPERRWPIGNSEPNALASDHSAAANEK